MAVKKKLQVFISSTYQDLKPERQAAVEAILKAGHIPAGMELFSAGSDSQLETIRRWIDESDVYMLILGGRYGSVDPKTSLSYTELEYDYAVANNKPLFSVVIKESALNDKVKAEGKDVMETENPKELKLFNKKVLARISSFFTDSKDIKLAVHETLADFQNRYEFAGWVSGKEVPDISVLLAEIEQLRSEKNAANVQLAALKMASEKAVARSGARWSDEEFSNTLKALNNFEITTAAFNAPDSDSKPIETTVLRILDVMRDRLITGVTNKAGGKASESLLYYNVCPKLELYELAELEKVAGMAWQRYRLTSKGKALLVFYDKKIAEQKESATPAKSSGKKTAT